MLSFTNTSKRSFSTFRKFVEQPQRLGKSNVTITVPLGIGTWAWGDKTVWKFGTNDFDESTIQHAFNSTLSKGIDFFDTAEVYGMGKSESFIGNFKKNITKDSLYPVIATKFMPLPWKFSQKSFFKSLHRSLERLQMETVDLYQIHSAAFTFKSVEFWADALAEAVEKGLVKAVGVSNYGAEQVRKTVETLSKRNIPLATNQIEFSLVRNNPEINGLLSTCKELGVTVIAYSPIGMGLLTGKYSSSNPPNSKIKALTKIDLQKLDELIAKMKEIAEDNGKTISQVALNWCICKGTVPIVGVKNISQLEENAGCLGWRLKPEEISELDDLAITKPNSMLQERNK